MNALKRVDGSIYIGFFVDAAARDNYFTMFHASRNARGEVGKA